MRIGVLMMAFGLSGGAILSAAEERVDFNSQIRPILSDKCYFCHGRDAKDIKGKLQIHSFELATSDRNGKGAAIVPGNPDKSLLWQHITSEDPDEVMPPPKRDMKLSAREVATIRKWIEQGAEYQGLWSLNPLPKTVKVPTGEFPAASNDIDRFVQSRLQREGLSPAKEAQSEILLRRLYLTLTGLVPTPAQIAEFKADKSVDAYGSLVDKLMTTDAFAEHLAVDWLDVARYADSYGYQVDRGRDVSPWRDWALRAFKNNLPYDQFIIQQLAGDMIPERTDDTVLATAFNRLHGMKVEGGSVPEEFRTEYVADRAQTAATAFMGLTLECCRCHDHKYDPVSMRDYYSTFALFNNIDEAGLLAYFDTSVPSPTLAMMGDNEKAELAKRQRAATDALAAYVQACNDQQTAFAAWRKDWDGKVSIPGILVNYNFDENKGGKYANMAGADDDEAQVTDGGSIGINGSVISIKHPKIAADGIDAFTMRLPGTGRIINLSEMEIYAGGKNIADQAVITQSSEYSGGAYPIALLTDGNKENFSHTNEESNPWIKIAFSATTRIDEIKIWNRKTLESRFHNAEILFIAGGAETVHMQVKIPDQAARAGTIALSGNTEVDGIHGKAVLFDGDTKITVGEVGPFARHSPFSISVAVEVPVVHSRAVILHRSQAWTDAGSRGYELLIHEGKLDFALIHFSPGDEIRVRTLQNVPVNQWTRITMTYDGSGHAAGIKLYLNGELAPTEIIRDHLTKEIRYGSGKPIELAARMRDNGFKNSKIDELAIFDRELTAIEVRKLHNPDARPADDSELFAYYQATQSAPVTAAAARLAAARKAVNDYLDGRPRMMVMTELPVRRKTFVLKRGEYSAPDFDQEVQPGPPAGIFPFGPEYSRDRLGFAKWLTHPEHPLTARVTVNRYWQMIVGQGIVKTTNDFGFQGALPIHPQLLDYLARSFIDSGWNVRALLKQIVMSHTFRQDSGGSPALLEKDPDNSLLARGPAYPMSAEMLRDSAMQAGDWLAKNLGGGSSGIESNRRSIYVSLQRNNPPPELTIFGATPRLVCSVKREKTSTPLQPLVLLNSPLYVKNARMVAFAALQETAAPEVWLEQIFLRLTSRIPADKEREILAALLQDQQAYFNGAPEVAANFLKIGGGGKPPKGMAAPDLAAWTVVASAIMNLDSFYIVR